MQDPEASHAEFESQPLAPEAGIRRWAILVEYDGTDWPGWQRQTNGLAIQEALEQALAALTGREASILGAGRTDAGVHALGQVAAFGAPERFTAANIVGGMNARLPATVRVRDARPVPDGFNPRRDALRRRYVYRVVRSRVAPALDRARVAWISHDVDWEKVRAALECFRGRHDFSAFRSSQCQATRTVLDLEEARLQVMPLWGGADGAAGEANGLGEANSLGDAAQISFVCRSFLHSMVRFMAGAALEAGQGRLTPDAIKEMLRSGQRGAHKLWCAPPQGLCLVEVMYPAELGLWRRESGL